MTSTKPYSLFSSIALMAALGLSSPAIAFDSGSTGADGPFNPLVSTVVDLPPDGIFNFTTVNISSGIAITFNRNISNTPVIFLASGDVTIKGAINLSGGSSTSVGASGDGNFGNDGLPGLGGPGGFDGGRGGNKQDLNHPEGVGISRISGAGKGPGGGGGEDDGCGGGGGGFSNAGANGYTSRCGGIGGSLYGSNSLLPLIGGSGGGGGAGWELSAGSGGGGGGGAILIASSGTVTVTGTITTNGGNTGSAAGLNPGSTGGGGSGGAIRIVATTISGNGTLLARGGATGSHPGNFARRGGVGSIGYIKLEAEIYLRTADNAVPNVVFTGPQDVFVAGMPTIRITSVAGVAAPSSPTGNADIVLPETTPNPVTVEFASTNVPVGNTVELNIIPSTGDVTTVVSNALSGTEENATASASVDIPDGPSVLSAEVTYTVTVAQSELYSPFAEGELVAQVRLSIDPQKGSMTTFITESGNEYIWPSNMIGI